MKVVPERVLTYQKDARFKQSPTVESSPWHDIMPLGVGCVRLTPSEYADVNAVLARSRHTGVLHISFSPDSLLGDSKAHL
jgi:hypothetical protein